MYAHMMYQGLLQVNLASNPPPTLLGVFCLCTTTKLQQPLLAKLFAQKQCLDNQLE
jgi:hypothetical protein